LNDPVTVTYLNCLKWYRADVQDDLAKGAVVNTDSADMTHGLVHQNMGQQQALTDAANVDFLMNRYGMVLKLKEVENG